MFGKVIVVVVLALVALSSAQSCLKITGTCVLGSCPTAQTCISNVCCVTNAAANCDNVMDEAFCTQNAAKCTDATLGPQMQQVCPATCMTCGSVNSTTTVAPGSVTTAAPGSCVDKVNPATGVSDCAKDQYLCNNAAYYQLMTEQCPKTCGRCSAGSTGTATTAPVSGSACVDKVNPNTGVSDCAADAYLCNNAAYYKLMTEQCPKTCGRC